MYNNSFNNTSIGLANTNFSDKEKLVPESIRFKKIYQAIAAKKTPIKIRAEQQTYSSDKNSLIRIILPNSAIYDTRKGYLTFDVTLTKVGGTYVRVHSGIFSIFNRLRILAGSTEIEDLRDFNRIYAILWEMTNPILVTGNFGATLGFDTQANRNALGAVTTQYACPLYSGVLNTELLPTDFLKSQLTLELYIENPTMCLESDGAQPMTITVSNVVYHFERLDLEPAYKDKISDYIRTTGLKLGFHTWERYISALNTGANQNLNISQRSSSMNGMLNIFVNSATINDPTTNDKFLTWLPLNLINTSLKINGALYPDEPIDTVYANRWEPYQIYLEWIQKWNSNGIIMIAPPLNTIAFATDRFVQIDDLEPFPELDDVINPFSTLSNTSTIIKQLFFSGPIVANYQMDSWIESFNLICIYPDGSVRVEK